MIDDDFLDQIKKFEGYEAAPKFDYRQYSSGWGTRAQPGERPSREEHERRLRAELSKATEFVDAQVPDLPEGVRKAMISLTMNAGGNWAQSGLGAQLRQGDYDSAQRTLLQYNKAGGQTLGGLQDRRATEASWFGPGSYDTEDRTAVGLGGSRAYTPEATTVPDNAGQRQMAEPRGILDLMGMTGSQPGQQPTGLLGMLSDPETMSYIAMMLKGANPHSQLDPAAMLTNAQTMSMRKAALAQQQAEQAADNRRADERLGMERERFGLTKSAHEEERAQLERDRKAREDFYSGRTREGAPEAATIPSTEPVSEPDKIRAQIQYYEDRIGTLGQKDQIQVQKQIDTLKKRLEPSATELKQYEAASGNLPQLESLKVDLERAKELVPKAASNAVTSFFDKLASNLGETIAGPQAMATAELDRKMKATALIELRKLLPGPASNKDVAIINDIAANPGMSPQEKISRIGGVLQRVESQIAKEKETIKRFRQKEGTYKEEEETGGGGTDLGGGWTVRVK